MLIALVAAAAALALAAVVLQVIALRRSRAMVDTAESLEMLKAGQQSLAGAIGQHAQEHKAALGTIAELVGVLDLAAVQAETTSLFDRLAGQVEQLGVPALRGQLVNLSRDVAAVHESLAALDLPGVRQAVAALQIAIQAAVAKAHQDLAAMRSEPLSNDARSLHESLDRVHGALLDQKQHAVVTEAVRERLDHERARPDKYPVDQRSQSVLQRARRRMNLLGVEEPEEGALKAMVDAELQRLAA